MKTTFHHLTCYVLIDEENLEKIEEKSQDYGRDKLVWTKQINKLLVGFTLQSNDVLLITIMF
jgi:hypothetical protein